ncbi:hypothetical protein HELRODRAFT_108146 [Helobdella robusta]|uniref:Aminotransferase class I/classII large domain-containing protein n=1 Tax=Helobdella robusta TaxID=6412 RepID=T1EEF9_HELRO|nr:hypothetical protein HELRODRAFT_108146 [Helobdella robusta]ESN92749.1 hypothetical protein HELRODRAFT_108146 [Helobdella robusta]
MSKKLRLADRLTGTESNVWVEFGSLAAEYKALNLGQGFPDFFPPNFVTDALHSVASNKENPFLHQYTRSYGHPRLVNALAQIYSKIFNRPIDAQSEILVTVGAYESLFCAHKGFVNPGDEVIIFEPFFDCYEPMVLQAGGIPRFVPLRSTKPAGELTSTADWTFSREELTNQFNEKTKMIIVNNPNNPLGKVFTREELEFIGDLCKKHDVLILADEVYERLVYPGKEYVRIANLPDLWDRTVTIGSAGKTFSVTGWKLGWSVGPSHLIKALCTVHQNSVYTCPTPMQEAAALGFERELSLAEGSEDSYFWQIPRELVPKKEKIMKMLLEIDMVPVEPQAGYFIVADISKTGFKVDPKNSESKDYQFVKWMCRNKKLSAIPNSAFYTSEHKKLAENLVRFCFIKEDSTLDRAANIFHEWRSSLKND